MDILLLKARTVRKQATVAKFKKILSKMLAICSLSGPQASNRRQIQKNTEQNARYLLTILTRREHRDEALSEWLRGRCIPSLIDFRLYNNTARGVSQNMNLQGPGGSIL